MDIVFCIIGSLLIKTLKYGYLWPEAEMDEVLSQELTRAEMRKRKKIYHGPGPFFLMVLTLLTAELFGPECQLFISHAVRMMEGQLNVSLATAGALMLLAFRQGLLDEQSDANHVADMVCYSIFCLAFLAHAFTLYHLYGWVGTSHDASTDWIEVMHSRVIYSAILQLGALALATYLNGIGLFKPVAYRALLVGTNVTILYRLVVTVLPSLLT